MGSAEGARKAREKALAKNPNHYIELARKGGAASNSRPFTNRKLAKIASKKGVEARKKKVLDSNNEQV